MSRVGKSSVLLLDGVKAEVNGKNLTVIGGRGTLSMEINPLVSLEVTDGQITVRPADESIEARAMWGTTRALTKNMVHGVSRGWTKTLTLVGVGYRAAIKGDNIELSLGFSHPVIHSLPNGVKATMSNPNQIVLEGNDKQSVGEQAAKIRAYRPPDSYKGKGVRYIDEKVVLKETKKK